MKRVLRYEVPVDDEVHAIHSGPVVYVAARDPRIVEFWAIDDNKMWREFTVLGTGHDAPDDYEYVGTAITAGGALVWHLMEIPS